MFTHDWLANVNSGSIARAAVDLPDNAKTDYKFVHDCFTQFLKNQVDRQRKLRVATPTLNAVSEVNTKARRAARRVRVSGSFSSNSWVLTMI